MARPAGVSRVDIRSSLGRRSQPSASNVRSAVTRRQSLSALIPAFDRLDRCVLENRRSTLKPTD